VKFSLKEIEWIFQIRYEILSFEKCLNKGISGFQRGDIFLNCGNTELKRSSKIFFFCFRTASLDGSGLNTKEMPPKKYFGNRPEKVSAEKKINIPVMPT